MDYELPAELIAQEPLAVRSDSRLLVLNRYDGHIQDSRFNRLGDFLSSADCLVLNDTKVLPARFFARRQTGGRLEGLFLEEGADGVWTVYLKGARRVKCGRQVFLKDRRNSDFCAAELVERMGSGKCRLKPAIESDAPCILARIGFPPLPPYIRRDADPTIAAADELRYQTVYAKTAGAVAAPTAGLHFTAELIQRLRHAGIGFAFVTLHVGAGTFKPVSVENLEDHRIHSETFSLERENAEIINKAKSESGRIIPVGTTSMRVLETVVADSRIRAAAGATNLFITPGYEFKIADAMITNFHLPRSTLLALVAAFAGLENVLAAYRHAVEQRYRFYSYGDAMLIM